VFDEAGPDAAAAAAVAAATAVLMARGIRILNGDLGMFDAGTDKEVTTEGSLLADATAGEADADGLQCGGESAPECDTLLTCAGDGADVVRTIFRLSMDEAAVGTAEGGTMLVPT
jgi:hypothetical protein